MDLPLARSRQRHANNCMHQRTMPTGNETERTGQANPNTKVQRRGLGVHLPLDGFYFVLTGIKVNPPGRLRMDFTFTSKGCDHGRLRDRGNMHKIKLYGGWATESSIVLDSSDPTVVPTTTDLYLTSLVGSRFGAINRRLPAIRRHDGMTEPHNAL
jgi:hypothetical protein